MCLFVICLLLCACCYLFVVICLLLFVCCYLLVVICLLLFVCCYLLFIVFIAIFLSIFKIKNNLVFLIFLILLESHIISMESNNCLLFEMRMLNELRKLKPEQRKEIIETLEREEKLEEEALKKNPNLHMETKLTQVLGE